MTDKHKMEELQMAKLNLTSSTTFLYFNDLEGAKRFFAETLGLPTALDQGWACIYRLGERSYLGATERSTPAVLGRFGMVA